MKRITGDCNGILKTLWKATVIGWIIDELSGDTGDDD
jgi:hypothetical protein